MSCSATCRNFTHKIFLSSLLLCPCLDDKPRTAICDPRLGLPRISVDTPISVHYWPSLIRETQDRNSDGSSNGDKCEVWLRSEFFKITFVPITPHYYRTHMDPCRARPCPPAAPYFISGRFSSNKIQNLLEVSHSSTVTVPFFQAQGGLGSHGKASNVQNGAMFPLGEQRAMR